jgi:CHAD domain-containing protein
VSLEPDWRADRACSVVLGTLAAAIEEQLPSVLADADDEHLHDLRVAVRRSRSVLKQMRRVFPPEEHERYRLDLRWVQEITSSTRDLDVQLLHWDDVAELVPADMRDDLGPLHKAVVAARGREHRRMVRDLRSTRFTGLRRGWPEFLDRLGRGDVAGIDDRPHAGKAIGDLAAKRVRKVYGRMVEQGRAIDEASPAEALHELRKRGKELRYLLELFGSLYDQDVVKRLVRELKDLQDVLGRHQDGQVQARQLCELAPALAGEAGGPQALVATGVIVARLADQQRDARTKFAARFDAFASKKTRHQVDRAFD